MSASVHWPGVTVCRDARYRGFVLLLLTHTVATYPLDLVRARLSIATANMAQTGGASAFTAEDARLGIVGMTKKVYRTEGGLRGLYRGCWATAVGVAPYGE